MYGLYNGEIYKTLVDRAESDPDQAVVKWCNMIMETKESELPKYQKDCKQWYSEYIKTHELPGIEQSENGPVNYPNGMLCLECQTFGIDIHRRRQGTTGYTNHVQRDNCGHKMSVPRPGAGRLHPEECPHADVNQSKSVRGIVRWFCIDCGSIVGQKPREQH